MGRTGVAPTAAGQRKDFRRSTKTCLPNIGSTRPHVLILDGHDNHNFLELIDLVIANDIHMVEFPAYKSHWLHPCDRTVFKPLNEFYNREAQELMS